MTGQDNTALHFLDDGGEMGDLTRAYDSTKLGWKYTVVNCGDPGTTLPLPSACDN